MRHIEQFVSNGPISQLQLQPFGYLHNAAATLLRSIL